MSKKFPKVAFVLSFAVVMTLGINALIVSSIFAEDVNSKPAVITSDNKSESEQVQLKSGETISEAVVTIDEHGNKSIVFNESLSEEERQQIEKDLESIKTVNSDDNPSFVEGTPTANDLTQEDALKIAKDALIKKYALSDKTLNMFSVHAAFNVVDPAAPTWNITFYPTNNDDFSKIGNYNVTIDSSTGKINSILSAADSIG